MIQENPQILEFKIRSNRARNALLNCIRKIPNSMATQQARQNDYQRQLLPGDYPAQGIEKQSKKGQLSACINTFIGNIEKISEDSEIFLSSVKDQEKSKNYAYNTLTNTTKVTKYPTTYKDLGTALENRFIGTGPGAADFSDAVLDDFKAIINSVEYKVYESQNGENKSKKIQKNF